jgi:hypothetical protein
MTQLEQFSQRREVIIGLLVTLFTTLLIHFPLLISDSVMWDGTIIHKSLVSGDFGIISDWLTSERHPQRAWISWATKIFPDVVFANKLFSFISLWLGSYFLAASTKLLFRISTADSLFISAITILIPVYVLHFELVMTPYTVAFFMFWLGTYFVLLHLQAAKRQLKIFTIFLVPAAATLFMAFCVESFLFFFYGILAVACFPAKTQDRSIKPMLMATSIPALMPVLYFLWVKTLPMPLGQIYGTYNRIAFPPDLLLIAKTTFQSLRGMATGPFALFAKEMNLTISIYSIWTLLLTATTAAFLFVQSFRTLPDSKILTTKQKQIEQIHLAFCAAFLLMLALLPYAMLGKFATSTGAGTRQAFLTPFPLALLCYLILLPCFQALNKHKIAGYSLLVISLTPFFFFNYFNQILWQNRYIKYQGIIQSFKNLATPPGKIVSLTDNTHLGYPEKLRFYEINWMLWQAFGTDSRLGLDSLEPDVEIPDIAFRKYYSMEGFDLPTHSIATYPKSQYLAKSASKHDELAVYWNYNLSRARGTTPQYLQTLVSLEETPAP